MPYRDDRQSIALQIAALERENERLRETVEDMASRYRRLLEDRHEARRVGTKNACALCGGTLLPVAVFAGHDVRQPIPLSLSTMRFGQPGGGFAGSAPIHARACTSCGFIHHFIDIERVDVATGKLTDDPNEAEEAAIHRAESTNDT